MVASGGQFWLLLGVEGVCCTRVLQCELPKCICTLAFRRATERGSPCDRETRAKERAQRATELGISS